MSVRANVFSILRTSLHDGPGVRTVAYLNGCSLRCQWCHNPEGFSAKPQVMFVEHRCIGCGACVAECAKCHSIENGNKVFDRDACTGCGRCVEACPAEALLLAGKSYTPAELVKVFRKDQAYYQCSGGGVTFSGGECLLYPDFVAQAAQLCQQEQIHVLVESALHIPLSNLQRVAPFVDEFYVDMKHMDTEKHKRYTGLGNQRILENLYWLAEHHRQIMIRTPVIPGVNDDWGNLLDTAKLAYSLSPSVKGYVLLRYNGLAQSKYQQLNLPFVSFADSSQDEQSMEALCKRLNDALEDKSFVTWSKP